MLPLLVLLASVTPDAVRALSPCSSIISHANDAISRTLQNDRALSVLADSVEDESHADEHRTRATVGC